MRVSSMPFASLLLCLLASTPAFSQSDRGMITGVAKDSAGAILQGAKVELQPHLRPATADGQGAFTITDVAAGTYAVKISYVGFAPYVSSVTVQAGQTAQINAVLKVASAADEVVVTAQRVI